MLIRRSTVDAADPIPEDFSSKPTIDDIKAAQAHSRASHRVARVWEGLVHLAKRIEPLLEGTPFKTPIAVFTAIADVVEVRLVIIHKTSH